MSSDELRIGPGELRRALDSREPVVRRGRLDPVTVVETSLADEGRVVVEAVLSNATGDVSLHGSVRATWEAPCRRCGDPLRGEVDAQVSEMFARDHVEGETYPFDGESLDLAPLARDAVTLELPFAPGPPVDDDDRCTICGREALGADDEPDAEDEPVRDPRWAALDDLDLDE